MKQAFRKIRNEKNINSPRKRYRKQGRKTTLIPGGRFGERRVCALGHVKMNEWKAYLNRSLALQWPIWIESWTKRPRPTNRLAEMSSLESEQAWTLRTSWHLWGRGGMASAEPKRKRSPKNPHQEVAAKPKNDDSGAAFRAKPGSVFGAGFRPRFWGRIPAPHNNSYSGPESGPRIGAGIRPSKWDRCRRKFEPIWKRKGSAIAIQFLDPRIIF